MLVSFVLPVHVMCVGYVGVICMLCYVWVIFLFCVSVGKMGVKPGVVFRLQ